MVSGLDDEPTAYLGLARFNNTLDFDFELTSTATHKATVTYALTDAPPDGAWPVLVLFNGLGGHRLIATLIEGLAREHRVQLLTLDKPGARGSSLPVALPLEARTRWMHAALLAVLAHHRITRFAALSHSNGLFYALYTLLHLPAALAVTSWTLTGPFVPQSISGSAALRLAAALPAPLPNALGTLLQAAPPVSAALRWSGGLLSTSAALLGCTGAGAPPPPHRRGFVERHASAPLRAETTRRALVESRVSIGQEALLSLHGGRTAGDSTSAGGAQDSVWGLGGGATDADVLRGAFQRLAARGCGAGDTDTLPVYVVYGAADGMVPAQGRRWLKSVLESTGLLRAEDASRAWTEVPDAGHDDVVFLEDVVSRIFERVQ
ncbi:hypothetical protein GGX14DRAFT_601138 [Mycena pura]|uniref:AB hydrolase-1 domain-containing protein n=1 Tax=Mycena pura TaxID=153505 RepID=A0AAD6URD4_9AGAR|nr:hypothetical protein GGX14DRAFT_601138 [Mycena pura]